MRYLILSFFFYFIHEPKKILVIGDSITDDGRYVAYYKEGCNCEIDILGFPGYTTSQIREEFTKVDLNMYELVIFEMGINNVEFPDQVKKDFIFVADKSRKGGVEIAVLTLPPFKTYPTWTREKQQSLTIINSWLKNDLKVNYVIDIYNVLNINEISVFSKDGLHPNETGHKKMCKEMEKIIHFRR